MPGLGNVRRVPWVHTCSVPWQRGSRGWQERLGAGRALQEGPCCGQDEPLLCSGTGCWVGAASKMLLETGERWQSRLERKMDYLPVPRRVPKRRSWCCAWFGSVPAVGG